MKNHFIFLIIAVSLVLTGNLALGTELPDSKIRNVYFVNNRTYLEATQVWLNETRDKWEIIGLILEHSKLNSVDFELAYELANFESNLDPLAKNPKSTAKGIYQFLDGTWKDRCEGNPYDAEDNIKCAMKLIGNGELGHWTADKNVKGFLEKEGFVE